MPPLFADVSPVEQWLGPIVAGLLSLGTAFIAYLGTRDKLRYDVRMATLEADNHRLKDDVARLTSQHSTCEEKHDQLQAEVSALRAELALLKKGVP